MKFRMLSYLLTGSAIVLAAWLVHAPKEAHADVPEKYQETVRKALAYLAKQQHADGHWEGEGAGGQHPVAMTGLVGLALVMEKNCPNIEGRQQTIPVAKVAKYRTEIRKAADWLIAQSQSEREGLLFSGHASETTRYMEGHGLATLFLAGAYMDEEDEPRRNRLAKVLDRAVKYIVRAQSSQGGWFHTSKVEGHDFGDPLVTVIQMQALQAAAGAGISFPGDQLNDGQAFLHTRLAKTAKAMPAGPGRRPLTETAAALAACFGLAGQLGAANASACQAWLERCQAEIPLGSNLQFGRDELEHYYYAQALFARGAEMWGNYRTAMFDHLQARQRADGSWPAASGLGVGPVYATALWCTLLQLDRNNHPAARSKVVIVD